MMCSRGLGILLKEESFIFLDLVHQRKKTTMLFVRLERPTVFYMYEPLFSLVQLKGANECTVVSDKIGFIVLLILISIVHLYLNCTKVHPLAVFITLMLHYNLFYLFIYFRKLAELCSIWNKRKKNTLLRIIISKLNRNCHNNNNKQKRYWQQWNT